MKCFKYCKMKSILSILLLSILLVFCASGVSAKWVDTSAGRKYQTSSGTYVKNTMKKIGKYYYYFDKKGIMQTGWVQFPAGWRYFGKKDGHMWRYLQTISKKQYYLGGNGLRRSGWQTIDGKQYFFGRTTGRMQKSKLVDNNMYYVGKTGVKKTTAGVITYNGNKYYVKKGGRVARNEIIEANGVTYIADNNGAVMIDNSALGNKIVEYALKFVGNPYVYGGSSLTRGTDCSGFTMSVFLHFNIKLLRCSYEQEVGPTAAQKRSGYTAGVSVPVNTASLKPGDLLFYGVKGYSGHVAIYIGNGKIVHAANEARGICIDKYNYDTPIKAMRYW